MGDRIVLQMLQALLIYNKAKIREVAAIAIAQLQIQTL